MLIGQLLSRFFYLVLDQSENDKRGGKHVGVGHDTVILETGKEGWDCGWFRRCYTFTFFLLDHYSSTFTYFSSLPTTLCCFNCLNEDREIDVASSSTMVIVSLTVPWEDDALPISHSEWRKASVQLCFVAKRPPLHNSQLNFLHWLKNLLLTRNNYRTTTTPDFCPLPLSRPPPHNYQYRNRLRSNHPNRLLGRRWSGGLRC